MIWLTCCALHNMLLHVDGLDKPWDGVNMPGSDYSGSFGELDFDEMPLAMQRLFSPDEVRAYDTSLMSELAVDDVGGDIGSDEEGIDGIRVVRNLSLAYFRGRLVEHFDIKFKDGKVKWPRSRGKVPRWNTDSIWE